MLLIVKSQQLKTKQASADSYQNETSIFKVDGNNEEVEKDFSEIDSFNKAIKHLKESFFGKDNIEVSEQIEKV